MSEFGDFEEIKEEKKETEEPQEMVPTRVRQPRQKQLMGVVVQRLGGNRMSVKTTDGKTRNCRVPGRFARKFWLRPGNAVLIEPWPDDDTKGDVVYQYNKNEMFQLKKQGFFEEMEEEF